MSYDKFSEEQLREVAEEFALEVDDDASEEDVRTAVEALPEEEVALSFPKFAELLADDDADDEEPETPGLITSGSTPKKGAAKKTTAKKATAKKTAAAPAAKSTVVQEDVTLVKMTRNNPVYEARGYRWDKNHPFVLVKNADVDFLIEVEGGFAVAKPSEVEAFYN